MASVYLRSIVDNRGEGQKVESRGTATGGGRGKEREEVMVMLLTEGEEKKRRRGEMVQAGGRPRIYTIDGGKGEG